MRFSILLISCYELGHQPLSLAWPLAALRAAGLDASTVDLAVEAFPAKRAAGADLIAVAVPMHTALRIGVDAARQARAVNSSAHLFFFGLYAWLNRGYLLHGKTARGRLLTRLRPARRSLSWSRWRRPSSQAARRQMCRG